MNKKWLLLSIPILIVSVVFFQNFSRSRYKKKRPVARVKLSKPQIRSVSKRYSRYISQVNRSASRRSRRKSDQGKIYFTGIRSKVKDLSNLEKKITNVVKASKKLNVKLSSRTKRSTLSLLKNSKNLRERLRSSYIKSRRVKRVSSKEVRKVQLLLRSYFEYKHALEESFKNLNSVVTAHLARQIQERAVASARSFHNNLINNEEVEKIKSDLKKVISTSILDRLNCSFAGTHQDQRNKVKQFFCDELPIGDTNVGTSYALYKTKFEEIHIDYNKKLLLDHYPHFGLPVFKKRKQRDWWCKDLTGTRCIDETVPASYETFVSLFGSEISKWRNEKTYFEIPVSYKDKSKTRSYNIKVTGERKFRSNFRTYDNENLGSSGNDTYYKTCYNIPGIQINAARQKFKYTIAKGFLGSVSVYPRVTFPGLSFDNISFCTLVKINASRKSIRILSLTAPRFENVRLTPLKIKFKRRFTRLVYKIVDKIHQVFEGGRILDLVNDQVANIEGDLQSGQLFVDVILDKVVKATGSQVTTNQNEFNRQVNSYKR